MGKLTAETWLGRAGLARGRSKRASDELEKGTSIGVLAFELARLMSKTAHLWHSLREPQILKIRDEVLHLEGVRKLISDDDDFLVGLALAEMMESLGFLASSVARLGKRCADPALQQFEHAFADLIKSGTYQPCGWEYRVKKMDRKVKKMERFVASGISLYQEMEVLAELEQGLRRMQTNSDPSHQIEFKRKVLWHRQEVKSLREVSLWNRSYDYVVRLLARSLFTIVWRIRIVFGLQHQREVECDSKAILLPRSQSAIGAVRRSSSSRNATTQGFIDRVSSSGPLVRSDDARSRPVPIQSRAAGDEWIALPPLPSRKRHSSKAKWAVFGGPFRGCMVGGNISPVLPSCVTVDSGFRRPIPIQRIGSRMGDSHSDDAYFQGSIFHMNLSQFLFESNRKLTNAPPSTLGAVGLALHYANVIVVIQKLAASPHLIGPDARDDLYNMLTTSIRAALRVRLKTYAKNLASFVYDPVLAAEWSEAITGILKWLAPLAHNMIRWQSERNFEQQHVVSNPNVLLLQTLYFANQMKTEAAITELLVGLNYLWRFGRELNAKAILECMSSKNFGDGLDFKDQSFASNHV
ncbi:hypothetical protein J5N97_021427 [Dioscorea zingiberensis]|uniref:Uncharacterized protein n=1 Tax=Dioscorea zingiberensis TaxID=325984 RepID=A0A9D5CHM0_9LILI|nr:hypothetical protein J5N97_021427 [Dioscorea zingiberensis]